MSALHRFASVVSVVVAFTLVSSSMAFAQSALEGQMDGRRDGQRHETYAWAWSFAWGFFAGLIGWGGSVLYYGTRSPEPDTVDLLALEDKPREYQLAYLDAYEDAARGKMLLQSAVGGGLGWLTWMFVWSAAQSSAAHEGTTVPVVSISW